MQLSMSGSLFFFLNAFYLDLKRFSPSEKYKSKLTASVEFSQYNLDLSSYATTGSRGMWLSRLTPEKKAYLLWNNVWMLTWVILFSGQNCTYNLYGVSNHSGTVYTGHYTAYCKHPYSGEWHDFNDSRFVITMCLHIHFFIRFFAIWNYLFDALNNFFKVERSALKTTAFISKILYLWDDSNLTLFI